MALSYYGVNSFDGVSQYHKITLTDENYSVTGYIMPGSSSELASNWVSPFQNDNLGSVSGAETVANLYQAATETTSIYRANSLKVWDGAEAPMFMLQLGFLAITDPITEVNLAIAALSAMISPELKDLSPNGRRPYICTIDVGRRFILADCVLLSMSYDIDAPKNSEGYYLRNTVALQVSGLAVQNRSEITGLFK
jgi:hypothetical protein